MMTSISNASFIYTPYLFRKDDRPRYTIGTFSFFSSDHHRCRGMMLTISLAMSAMAGFSLLCLLCAWAMKAILVKQNKTLAQKGSLTKYPY